MIIPVRCFSCGKVIAEKYEEFKKRIDNKENPGKVLDDLGIKRYCCRRTLLSHVDLLEEIMEYT